MGMKIARVCMYGAAVFGTSSLNQTVILDLERVVMQPLQRWQEAQDSKCLLKRIKGELIWQTGALWARKNSGRGDLFSISMKNACRKGKREVGRNRQQDREKDETQGKLAGGIN